jgi:hypothetical protein
MATYIGKRIVPVHCGKWDMAKAYEMLSIVLEENSGDSYIARRAVPVGTAITDTHYWTLHSLYSQQIKDMSDQLAATEQRIVADNDVTEAAIRQDNDATEAAIRQDNQQTREHVDSSLEQTTETLTETVTQAQTAMTQQKASFDETAALLNTRMDAVLAAGTGDGATEMADARLDYNEVLHASLGEAIRTPMRALKNEIERKAGMLLGGAENESIPLVWTDGKAVTSSGEIINVSGCSATVDFIPFYKGVTLEIYCYAPGTSDVVCFYDLEKELVTSVKITNRMASTVFEMDYDGFIRLSNEPNRIPSADCYLLCHYPRSLSDVNDAVCRLEKDVTEQSPHISHVFKLEWSDQTGYIVSGSGSVGISNSFRYTPDYYRVFAGQKLYLHLYANGINECAAAFYDLEKHYTGHYETSNGKALIVVQADGYARFSNNTTKMQLEDAYVKNVIWTPEIEELSETVNETVEKTSVLEGKASEWDALPAVMEGLNEEISTIGDMILTMPFDYPLHFTDGAYLYIVDGSSREYERSSYTADYYPVRGGQQLLVKLYAMGASDVAIAYYDEEKKYLREYEFSAREERLITVPEDARFARFCNNFGYVKEPFVRNIVAQEEDTEDTSMARPMYPSSLKESISNESTMEYMPSTLPLNYTYKGQVDNEKKFLAIGFDDFRASDFSMIIPLFDKYGARAVFNRVATKKELEDSDIKKINQVIFGGHELGDHTWMHYNYPYSDPLFNGQNPDNPDGDQIPYPSNEQMRADRGDGKNALGKELNASVSGNKSSFTTTWAQLTDEQCQVLREDYSVMKDTSLCNLLDALSNKYLGTEGQSDGSWDDETGKYTGGIFTGSSTSDNHEIWERMLLLTYIYYKDQYGLNWRMETWSWPGSKGSGIAFENNGHYYYDEQHTQFKNSLAKFASSLYQDESGEPKVRSWSDVLREFGYVCTHDALFPGRSDGNMEPAMSKQFILNAHLSRKDAIPYSTNRSISYSAIATAYPESFFTEGKSKEEQMYKVEGPFRSFIESIRRNTSNGMIHGEVIDSTDTYSMRVFLEAVLQYCKKTGVEVITKAEAFDVCFHHKLESGNLVYNPTFRNTAKEFLPNDETVPTNPDGYTGNCSVSTDEYGVNSLITNGDTSYIHYGIPYGRIRYSAEIKGNGQIHFYLIKNSDPANELGATEVEVAEINSPDQFSNEEIVLMIPNNKEREYDFVCEGLGEKVMGMKILYSSGMEIKNIHIEKK